MSDETRRVRRGSTVDLLVSDQSDAAKAIAGTRRSETGGALLPDDEDDDLYLPQKRGITIYDMGVRMGEDGDFSQIGNGVAPFDGLDVDASTLGIQWNAAMIADGIEKSMPLPLEAENLYVDMVFRNPDAPEPYTVLLGRPNTRALVRDSRSNEGDPAPPAVDKTDWKSGRTISKDGGWSYRAGQLKFSKGGQWSVGVQTGPFYNSFDTSDTASGHFKVTNDPDPAADPVDLFVTKGRQVKIFLTPRMFYSLDGEAGIPGTLYTWRLPILPAFKPGGADIGIDGVFIDPEFAFDRWTVAVRPSAAYSLMIQGQIAAVNPALDMTRAQFLAFDARVIEKITNDPVLAAAVSVDREMFYIWRTGYAGDFLDIVTEEPFFKYADLILSL